MTSPPSTWRGFFYCVIATAFITQAVTAAPVISEFMAINSGVALVDEDGDSSDWIEVHNPEDEAVDLEGITLSDDSDRPGRWAFPAVTLEAGAYLIVFASGKDRAVAGEELHADFSLSGNGEFLGLADSDGAFISQFDPEFPQQQRDISYGIAGDGGQGYFLDPSPGMANPQSALDQLLEAPSFSVPHGFFQSPVTLEINTPVGNGTVLFTTDGSEPGRLNGQIYRGPLTISKTTVLRAIVTRPGSVPSGVATSSYLFAGDVKNQPGMAQVVVDTDEYREEIEQGLAGLPVMSMAVAPDDFLGPQGIYTKFEGRGREAEVAVSIEYFDPADGGADADTDTGFQIDAGVRIHGGQARFHEKKPLRLYFRSDYGAGRLQFPLFDGSPVQEFDRLILRGCGHDGWAIDWGDGRNDLTDSATYMRDEFMRRSEQEMGMLSPRGSFVQLFINGEYWGLYNLHERADSAFFASHEGGDGSDWDVVEGGGFLQEGNTTAWSDLLAIGANGVGTAVEYAEAQRLVEMDSFIDSMISRIWSGDNDWLGPVFFGGFSTGPNNRNWYGGRRSRGADDQPFQFFSWDAEISLGNDRFNDSGNRQLTHDLSRVDQPGSPGVVYDGLRGYEEFQINFADRLYRHFFNDGALSAERNQVRWDQLSELIRSPVVAESARWGNIHGGVPLTRDSEWDSERLWVRNTFFQQRNGTVLGQFRNLGLYPRIDPPSFTEAGGAYEDPIMVTISTAQAGRIFFTSDGSDPRRAASVDPPNVLLAPFQPARVLVPSVANGGAALGASWFAFDDPAGIDGWQEGEASVGYETAGTDYRSLLRVDVEEEMFDINGSVYMRVEFEIENQAEIDEIARLVLRMKYDDGFVAYLNGTQVAEANAPATPVWNSLSIDGNSDLAAVIFEDFDISGQSGLLRVGRNVLALQGLNGGERSSDLLLHPAIQASTVEVSAGIGDTAVDIGSSAPVAINESAVIKSRVLGDDGTWSALRVERYEIGSRGPEPGDLAISELSYRPLGPQGAAEEAVGASRGDYEFIEVLNLSEDTLDLGGIGFDAGLDFDFPPMELDAGERVLLVSNLAAFQVRYPLVPAAQIVGEFANDTQLSNGGERISLLSAGGTVLIDFEYDDSAPWPTTPDGDGPTLTMIDPLENPDPTVAANWRASRLVGGSPGGDVDSIDVDMDGLPDVWEQQNFGDLAQVGTGDLDGDGLDHDAEFEAGSDPQSVDTDGDGLLDQAEIDNGTDPVDPDSDGDGLSDGDEVLVFFSDPLERDSDGDGLGDAFEVMVSNTDPNSRDSDGDGSGDFSEVQSGSDPNDDSQLALARASELRVYASLDSLLQTGGGLLEPGALEVDGVLDGALEFSAGESLRFPQLGDPGLGNLSAVVWFKARTIEGQRSLVEKGSSWGLDWTAGSVIARVGDSGDLTVGNGIVAEIWHQLALVIDREIGVARVFLDGEERVSMALDPGELIDSPSDLVFAGGAGAAGICLDELVLFDFALSGDEVSRLFDGVGMGLGTIDLIDNNDSDADGLDDAWELAQFGGLEMGGDDDADDDGLDNREEQALGTDPNSPDTDSDGVGDRAEINGASDPTVGGSQPQPRSFRDGLLLYSPFDDLTVTGTASGSLVFDLSDPSDNGIVGGGIGIVPGVVAEAARVADGQVNFSDVHDPGEDDFSVSLWFRAEHLAPGQVQRIAGKGGLIGDVDGWQILVLGDEVAVTGRSGDQEWFVRGMPAGQSRVRVGGWNHVALVIDRDPENGAVSLFVNGEEVDSGIGSERFLPDGGVIESTWPLVSFGGGGISERQVFSGSIDDLAIWSRTISAADAQALYRGGVIGSGVARLSGDMGELPDFSVDPGVLSVVINPGEIGHSESAMLTNQGTGTGHWVADLQFSQNLELADALANANDSRVALIDSVPFVFPFLDGTSGQLINDGGLDMYDNGNILSTDLEQAVSYTGGQVVPSAAFGPDGQYFTRKLAGGMFILGADLDGIEYFDISGGLGADGVGAVSGTVLRLERGGRSFLGFVKKVYDGFDPFSQSFDPSVNHLIIIEDNGIATHEFSTNTDFDNHRVSNLAGVDRLFYLLYSSQDGIEISDEDTQVIFENFVDLVAIEAVWAELQDREGQLEAGGEVPLNLVFDVDGLVPGVIQEANLRILSNDPMDRQIDVPVRLRINESPVEIQGPEIVEPEDSGPLRIDLRRYFTDDGEADGEELMFTLLELDGMAADPLLSTIDGAFLEVALVQDAFGEIDAQLRATDPQGLMVERQIEMTVTPVNDRPFASRELSWTIEEDGGPAVLSLRDFFGDVEDGSAGLDFQLRAGAQPGGSIIANVAVDAGTGSLEFDLLPDANGEATIPLVVIDSEGARLEAALRVTVTPVNDRPFATRELSWTIEEDGGPAVLSLRDFFGDVEDGSAGLDFQLGAGALEDGEILASVAVDGGAGSLEFDLLPDANGEATIPLEVFDSEGGRLEAALRVIVTPVNDRPFATRELSWTIEEDGGPAVLSLRDFFGDVEDGSTGLDFQLGAGALADGAIITNVAVDGGEGSLEFDLLPDANGEATVPLEVIDTEGGRLEAALRVIVTPVNDAPDPLGQVDEIVADEAAADFSIGLAPFFSDRDGPGELLAFSLVGNSNPGLFASVSIDPQTGVLSISYAPFLSGEATLTVRATDPDGLSAEQQISVRLPEIDPPELTVGEEMRLNRQTGLWEQTITVRNDGQRDIGALRLTISGLPEGVRVHNASDALEGGEFELIYNRTLAVGETATMIVEYYSADRRSDLDPEIEVEVSLRQSNLSTGEGTEIDRVLRLRDGGMLVEFSTEPGDLYLIQYSSDMLVWRDSFIRLRAGGTRVQWIDRGPPATDSIPDGSRYYRVLRQSE